MQFQPANMTPGDIAVVALIGTIIAALVAFTGSLTVAIVNAVAARKLELAKARRDYRLKALQPVLDYMEDVIKGLEVITLYLNASEAELQAAVKDASVKMDKLTGMGVVSDHQALKDKWKAFRKADEDCFSILGEVDRLRARREALGEGMTRFAAQVNVVRRAAMDFRSEVEKFVF